MEIRAALRLTPRRTRLPAGYSIRPLYDGLLLPVVRPSGVLPPSLLLLLKREAFRLRRGRCHELVERSWPTINGNRASTGKGRVRGGVAERLRKAGSECHSLFSVYAFLSMRYL